MRLVAGLLGGIFGGIITVYLGCLILNGGCFIGNIFGNTGMSTIFFLSAISGSIAGIISTAGLIMVARLKGDPSGASPPMIQVVGFSFFIATLASGGALFVFIILALLVIGHF